MYHTCNVKQSKLPGRASIENPLIVEGQNFLLSTPHSLQEVEGENSLLISLEVGRTLYSAFSTLCTKQKGNLSAFHVGQNSPLIWLSEIGRQNYYFLLCTHCVEVFGRKQKGRLLYSQLSVESRKAKLSAYLFVRSRRRELFAFHGLLSTLLLHLYTGSTSSKDQILPLTHRQVKSSPFLLTTKDQRVESRKPSLHSPQQCVSSTVVLPIKRRVESSPLPHHAKAQKKRIDRAEFCLSTTEKRKFGPFVWPPKR